VFNTLKPGGLKVIEQQLCQHYKWLIKHNKNFDSWGAEGNGVMMSSMIADNLAVGF
jgi:hypothetical protein